MKNKLFPLILAIFSFVLIFISLRQFQVSESYRKEGDSLIARGKAKEAVIVYSMAQQTFPFRWNIKNDIQGAQLILESDLQYIESYKVGDGEIQMAAPLPIFKNIALKNGEYFVPIVMYHHIGINPSPNDPISTALYISPDFLDQQLSYIESHKFNVITLSDLYLALEGTTTLPDKPIVLTFDDGYRSFYDYAYPLLKKHNMKAINFVITQVVGASPYLTWPEILEMDKSGLIEFGAHTRHHPNLPDISHGVIVDEIKGSKSDLEYHLHKKIDWFAYPYGSYNDFAIQTVKESGFKGAVSTIFSPIQSKDKMFILARMMANGRYGLDNFIGRITMK